MLGVPCARCKRVGFFRFKIYVRKNRNILRALRMTRQKKIHRFFAFKKQRLHSHPNRALRVGTPVSGQVWLERATARVKRQILRARKKALWMTREAVERATALVSRFQIYPLGGLDAKFSPRDQHRVAMPTPGRVRLR